MQNLRTLYVPSLSSADHLPREGYRYNVHEIGYLPERGIAWIRIKNGTFKLPKPYHALLAQFDDVVTYWGLPDDDLFPCDMRFAEVGGEFLVDIDRPY